MGLDVDTDLLVSITKKLTNKERRKFMGLYKFRCWDKERKKMNDFGSMPMYVGDLELPDDEFEIMQYTGLKDKNGKEIFEGDILSFNGYMTADDSFGFEPNGFIYDEDSKHVVVWNHQLACWELNFDEDEHWKYKRDTRGLMVQGNCEIVGNIYENPELLNDSNLN